MKKSKTPAVILLSQGKKAQVDVNRLRLQQYVEETKAVIDIYNAQVSERKDIRDAQKTRLQGETEVYRAQVQAFDAEASTLIKAYDLGQTALEKQYRAQVTVLAANTEVAKRVKKAVEKITLRFSSESSRM